MVVVVCGLGGGLLVVVVAYGAASCSFWLEYGRFGSFVVAVLSVAVGVVGVDEVLPEFAVGSLLSAW